MATIKKTVGHDKGKEDLEPEQMQIGDNEVDFVGKVVLEDRKCENINGVEEDCPKEVKRRLNALRKIQFNLARVEADFHKELQQLEMKFSEYCKPIFEMRRTIITGEYEPNDDDCDTGESDNLTHLDSESEEPQSGSDLSGGDTNNKISGIPEFWLSVFANVYMLTEATSNSDIPILKHLMDIKSETFIEPKPGFSLQFLFSTNPYFNNSILTKVYYLKTELAQGSITFQGPLVNEWIGCTINWNQGKDVTAKKITSGGEVLADPLFPEKSFFNFFNPPNLPDISDSSEISDLIRLHLMEDFELGQYICERVIPRAYLFYTGEICQTDHEDESDDEDEEYDSDSDDGSGDTDAGDSIHTED